MPDSLQRHWPEYLMEALEIALFMISACLVVALLEHPSSPVRQAVSDGDVRRILTGLAMGATAVAIIYSPWGKQSGAHFNPAVTLAFLRLGKIQAGDALFYILAQLLGAALGVIGSRWMLGEWLGHPAVGWVATRPGPSGTVLAFAGELLISFSMMSLILAVSNTPALSRFTGFFAGAAVATFIALEAPFSGMSMNPARSLGPALVGMVWDGIWIYLVAPPLGMLLAAEVHLWRRGRAAAPCAKLHHDNPKRCIFCGAEAIAPAGREHAAARPAKSSSRATATLLAALVLAADPLHAGAEQQAAEQPGVPLVFSVEAVGLTVSDADRAAAFFSDVLSFKKISDVEVVGEDYERLEGLFGLRLRVVRMRLGEEEIELYEYLVPRGRPLPVDSRSNDLWFQHIAIVVSDMDRAYARLRQHRVEHASTGPQTLPAWNENAGGIRAFYFKDPDGHPLELIQFPPGKGDPRWQKPTDELFLGIDHTAIVVDDTEESLAFYRDGLGLRIAGESENYGTEQEHLNNVFGARLRITGLRAANGPGIELLEYLAPTGGRPIPPDHKANDLAHWQTRLEVTAVSVAERALHREDVEIVSPGAVSLAGHELGFATGLLVRDPDGHAILLAD